LIKYGVSEHSFEIIDECPVEQIYEREIYWIKFYNAVEDGLNILEGGQGVKMTQEIKNKISNKKKNHICYQNKERGEKISQSLKGRKNTWGKGKEKIGKKQEKEFKERLEILKSKRILQFDKNGNFIQEWNSIKNAADSTRIHRENIGCVLRGITKTAGGYNWKYK
jgi:group I intron endonuclease